MTEIRRLEPDEIDAARQVWETAGLAFEAAERDSVAALTRQLETTSAFLLGCFDGADLVGVALGTDDGRKGWIGRVAVVPSHRRRGIATRLIRACDEDFAGRGIEVTASLVYDDNDPSIELFRAAGYTVANEITYLRKPGPGR